MGIDSSKKKVSKEMIDYAHSKGVMVNTWTVDSGEQMQDLIKMGVDFISTNILMHRHLLRSSGKVKSVHTRQSCELSSLFTSKY